MNFKKNKKIGASGSLKKTATKGFALTSQDLENIKIIKNRLLDEKVSLTDSAVVRVALKLAANSNKESLVKTSAHIEKITLGRPKGS